MTYVLDETKDFSDEDIEIILTLISSGEKEEAHKIISDMFQSFGLDELGGPGSGYRDHKGRPGQVGGSAKSGQGDIEEFFPVINSYMFHVNWWNELSGKMTEDEKISVERYTDGYYKVINKTLRKQKIEGDWYTDDVKKNTQDAIKGLDSVIAKSKANENFTVFRGAGIKSHEVVKKLTTVGETFSDPGFYSTSLSRKRAEGFLDAWEGGGTDILVSIKVPKGQTIAPVTGPGGSEEELIFPRNTEFKVISADLQSKGSKYNEHYWFVELELTNG